MGIVKTKIILDFFFLSAKDVQKGELVYTNARQITYKDFLETHRRTNLKAGDICIVNTGATIGKTAIPQDNNLAQKTTFQKSVAIIKTINTYTCNYFLEIFLKNETSNLLKKSSGSAINNLLLGDMRKLYLPLPPLSEQQAIVSIVESLFEKIDQLHEKSQQKQALQQKTAQTLLQRINAQNANLQEDWQLLQTNFGTLINQKQAVKQLRQTILQLAVQGKLTTQFRITNDELGVTESGADLLEKIKAEKQEIIKQGKLKRQKPLPKIEENEIPFDIPDSWVWTRIDTICGFQNGYSFKSHEMNGSDIGIIKIGDIQNGIITEVKMKFTSFEKAEKIKDEYYINTNDVVIAMSGATTGKIGVNKSEKTYLLNQRVGKFIFPTSLNQYFVFSYIEQNRAKLLTTSNGSIIDNLSTEQIKSFLFPLPSLAEQQAIVSIVEKLLKMCDNLEQKIEESENLNKKLMQTIVKEYT